MRIGIVTQFPFPQSHDQRARQLAKTLAQGGHSVTVFTPLATDSDLDGHGIAIRMPDGPKLLRKPVPFNEYWRRWLTSQGNQLQIDCFISKQLRLATSTWMAARRLGARFCVDLSENYPAMVQVEREGQILLPAFKQMARFLEVFCARRADMVIVVTESNRQRLIGLGVQPERLTVVATTPDLGQHPQRKPADTKPLGLVFVGLISKVRGLDRLLTAISQVRDREALHLHIFGTGPEKDRMEAIRDQLGLRSCVTFHGWMSRSQIGEVLGKYDVGVIPHIISEHTNTTIPGKLFDYMAAGLPVLATAMLPCKEVIDHARCGWLALDDPESLRKALEDILATTPEFRFEVGERGRRAFESQYNWNIDGGRFLNAIDVLGRNGATFSEPESS